MIWIKDNVTELAAGYEVIEGFLVTLETTWLPGFLRSYERRSAEYEKALEKYAERGLFLRTLFRKPKRPNRPPVNYRYETAVRMRGEWRESFKAAEGNAAPPPNLMLDDAFYAVNDLRLGEELAPGFVAVGPPGIVVTADGEEMARVTADLLAGTEMARTPVLIATAEEMREEEAGRILNAGEVFVVLDTLLGRGQALREGKTFSARVSAEKLAEREKDNLLRMAATL